MKKLPLLIAVSLLLTSLSATAAMFFEQSVSKTLTTITAPTKSAAYQLGVNKLAQLKDSSPSELERALGAPIGAVEANTMHLNDEGFIMIQERMDANGQLSYTAIVEVSVGFVPHSSDH